jgi:hypothetical protein
MLDLDKILQGTTTDRDYIDFEAELVGNLKLRFYTEMDPEINEIVRQAILKIRLVARDRWIAQGGHNPTRIYFEEPNG